MREEKKLKAGEYLQTLILLQGFLNKRSSHGSLLGNPFKRKYFYLSSVLLQFGKEPDDPVCASTGNARMLHTLLSSMLLHLVNDIVCLFLNL